MFVGGARAVREKRNLFLSLLGQGIKMIAPLWMLSRQVHCHVDSSDVETKFIFVTSSRGKDLATPGKLMRVKCYIYDKSMSKTISLVSVFL